MNICVIPARGGSKRIPHKNIKEFNGKPIIAYSIEAAIQSNCFDKVIVSTDDDKIAEVAKKYGAEIPFIRPIELSDNYTATLPVIKHAIQCLEDNGNLIENVCCLYATAPFIQPKIIYKAFQQLQQSKAGYCFGVTSFSFPIQRAIKITHTGRVKMFHPENFLSRSQDLEESYHDAGQFCWGKSQSFKDEVSTFSEASSPYILPRYLVQDIDTIEDWIMAESMYKSLQSIKILP